MIWIRNACPTPQQTMAVLGLSNDGLNLSEGTSRKQKHGWKK
jgi:hypothetical protein